MNTSAPLNALLIDLLRTQEGLRLDVQQLTRLCQQQALELQALKGALRNEARDPAPSSQVQAPSILWALRQPYQNAAEISAFMSDARRTFHPSANTLLPNSAYIRYRQIQGLSLSGQRIAALTTPRCELAELRQVTGAHSAQELRICHVDGPIEIVEHHPDGRSESHWLSGSLLALPWLLARCDLLWIPDPALASLVLKLDGLVEGFAEKVALGVQFMLDTQLWDEDAARRILHGAGFVEVVRPFAAGPQRYITRMHESQGCYPLIAPTAPASPGPSCLLASKRPTPAFDLHAEADGHGDGARHVVD